MLIKLQDIAKLEKEKPCFDTIHATVIDKSAVTRYGGNKTMATVVLADDTTCIKALVYDMETLKILVKDSGVQIQDFIPKQDR